MSKKSVLLIEDQFEFRKSFRSYFNVNQEWVLVAEAPSSRKALKVLQDFSPSLVLCRDYVGTEEFIKEIPDVFWSNKGVLIQYHYSKSQLYFDDDTRCVRDNIYDIALFMKDARLDEKKLSECLISILNGRPLALKNQSAQGDIKIDPKEIASKVIAIGSSAGGPRVLKTILQDLPAYLDAAVLIVQHLPSTFSDTLVQSLKQTSALPVHLAGNGMIIKKNNVYVAPGGFHMEVKNNAYGGYVSLNTDTPRWNLRPCVDILFESLPKVYGNRGVGVILTGLGTDGTDGARILKSHGFKIIAQNKETSMVYGMPGSVVEAGLCDHVLQDDLISKVASALITRI